ncbi:Nn.00g047980.m01.CDS01 [Neocucurbitaria sp. VM-36]
MDPLSITGTVIAIIHLSGVCLKLGNQHLGPSRHTTTTLTSLIQELYCFFGAMKSLQTHLEINEHDSLRLSSLDCLDEPLRDCNVALCLVEKRLRNKTFLRKKLIGKHYDMKLDDAMNILRKGRGLFEIVLLADQRTITSAIERYTINIAEDMRDMKSGLEDGGELVRSLTRQVTLQSEAAGERHDEMKLTLQEIEEKLSKDRNEKRERRRSKRWVQWIAIAGQSAIQFAIQLALTSIPEGPETKEFKKFDLGYFYMYTL